MPKYHAILSIIKIEINITWLMFRVIHENRPRDKYDFFMFSIRRNELGHIQIFPMPFTEIENEK